MVTNSLLQCDDVLIKVQSALYTKIVLGGKLVLKAIIGAEIKTLKRLNNVENSNLKK